MRIFSSLKNTTSIKILVKYLFPSFIPIWYRKLNQLVYYRVIKYYNEYTV